MDSLIDVFDIEGLSRAPARFDIAELENLNARIVHELDYEDVKSRLAGMKADGGETFWLAIRGNLGKLDEAKSWYDIIYGEAQPTVQAEDRDFVGAASALLPPEPWNENTWKDWTEAVKADSGRKGKQLFMPLRLALTGEAHGPELANLLPLIGRERALQRLQAAAGPDA
jgi:glutamyl-tRNA synthetase